MTLVMFPILVTMYVKLARREEDEVTGEFGEEYRRYMARAPVFSAAKDDAAKTGSVRKEAVAMRGT